MPNAIRIHTKEKIRAQAGIEPTTLGPNSDNVSLLGHVSKLVSTLLSTLSHCLNLTHHCATVTKCVPNRGGKAWNIGSCDMTQYDVQVDQHPCT